VQWGVVVVALAAAAAVAVSLPSGGRLMSLFALGLASGVVLYLSAYSFAGAYRALLTRRETFGVRAQLIMLGVATLLFAPLLGQPPGIGIVGAVAPVGMPVAIGAFAFGIGMQLAGGCGSGTLYSMGGGSWRMAIVLIAFCAGSFWASLHMDWWQRLPSWGEIELGRVLGWPGAVAAQFAVLAVLWIVLLRMDREQHAIPDGVERSQRAGRHRRLLGGAVLLAVLNALVLVVAGHPWTITWAFALWGAKVAMRLGWDPAAAPFWQGAFQSAALSAPVLHDTTSVTNAGIMLGALSAAGGVARFHFAPRMAALPLAAAVLGGLVMGYGARIAYGCNIGAFFSGVASTSLHGWLWIAAALVGNAVGVRLRSAFGLPD